MLGKLTLEVTEGPMKGRKFEFEEHDTFIFGRMSDCHMCLPDDPKVSRHHFIMEVNPPDACIRDLGSLNGTWVNGKKHGSRQKGETPEEAAQRHYPEVKIKEGDRIEVGDTIRREAQCRIMLSNRYACVVCGMLDFSSYPSTHLASCHDKPL